MLIMLSLSTLVNAEDNDPTVPTFKVAQEDIDKHKVTQVGNNAAQAEEQDVIDTTNDIKAEDDKAAKDGKKHKKESDSFSKIMESF